jgi:hypothetical protein
MSISSQLINPGGENRKLGDFLMLSSKIKAKTTIFGCGCYLFPGLDIL